MPISPGSTFKAGVNRNPRYITQAGNAFRFSVPMKVKACISVSWIGGPPPRDPPGLNFLPIGAVAPKAGPYKAQYKARMQPSGLCSAGGKGRGLQPAGAVAAGLRALYSSMPSSSPLSIYSLSPSRV